MVKQTCNCDIFISARLKVLSIIILTFLVLAFKPSISALSAEPQTVPPGTPATKVDPTEKTDTISMLKAIVKLQDDIRQQTETLKAKMAESTSETEKANLNNELAKLDKQLAETGDDFERIATNVEVAMFNVDKADTFSWQDELTELIRPAITELKRFTVRSRKRTKLRDSISDYERLAPVAEDALQHLNHLIIVADDPEVAARLRELLPEWQNISQRIQGKLELAELELTRLEDSNDSLADMMRNSTKTFFRDRGIYLFGALAAFIIVLLIMRVVYRWLYSFLLRTNKELPFHLRLIDLLFRAFAIFLATLSCFLVLYLAEDWFLLSMAIIFLLGLFWTIRQGVVRMWQQARLMLNIGPVREGERLTIDGVPWKVERIQIFCTLHNPSLDLRIRIPVEQMIGMISRPFKPEEPWFPCLKGDWVVIGDRPRGKVVSLSHEAVELVERGGTRVFYQTADFLAASPVNLSRNFRLRVPFGLSYNLQATITSEVISLLQHYIEERFSEQGYDKNCLNLSVEFMQAGESSLDLLVLADFKGDLAAIYKRLERYIQRCCVEACNINGWEIPFPQLTVHHPSVHDRQQV